MSNKTKVLYIVGAAHSGSTILHSILGQFQGWMAVGELRVLWKETLVKNLRCGCGKPFQQCDFWQRAVEHAYGGLQQVNVQDMERYATRVGGRCWPLVFLPGGRRVLASMLGDFPAHMAALYRSIRESSGCRVIVDESKSPVYAHLLSGMPDIDLYILHLIRDPRGVAYSHKKRGEFGVLAASMYWNIVNATSEALRRSAPERYWKLCYEDFCRRPREVIEQVSAFLQEPAQNLPFVDERSVCLGAIHSVCGNDNRFHKGNVELSMDETWRSKLSRWDQAVVSALTLPIRRRYGYAGT